MYMYTVQVWRVVAIPSPVVAGSVVLAGRGTACRESGVPVRWRVAGGRCDG